MIRTDVGTWYSASDLLNWLGCHHRTALDNRALGDPALGSWLRDQRQAALLLQPDADDATDFDTPAKARGDEHERAMLQRLVDEHRSVTTIDRPESTSAGIAAAAARTLAAMRDGADVVFQAALLDAPWFGFADFLVRVDGVPSDFGDYSYEVRDTKLARHPSASALIQMAHYGAILETVQGTPPPRLLIWLGTGDAYPWPYSDAAPYLLELRSRFLSFVGDGAVTEPDPVPACGACRWTARCSEQWGPADLINVHGLSRRQRRSLNDQDIRTIPQLAKAQDGRRPNGMATATFDRLREQAQVQSGKDDYRLIRPQSSTHGLAGIPDPDPADIYFDLEGDPFAAYPTLDYLWAYCDADDRYVHRWAHTPEAEREAFAWFMGDLQRRDAEGGAWHVYHYNTYELTSMRRIARDWPDTDLSAYWTDEVARLIDTRFVDLYRSVEQGLRTRHGSTSLKIVEKLAGHDRSAGAAADAVSKADDSIVAYERFITTTDEAKRSAILAGILDYNTHDVRATHAVHLWLHAIAADLGPDDVADEPEPYVPSEQVLKRIDDTIALRDRLLDAHDVSAGGVGLLAHLLEWHRAESSAAYLDFLRLKRWALEEADPDSANPAGEAAFLADDTATFALDGDGDAWTNRIAPGAEHESCLLDVQLIDVGAPTSSRANARRPHRFRCRPGSWKVKAGDTVETARADDDGASLSFGVSAADPAAGTFTILRGAVPHDVGPLVLQPFTRNDVVWQALMRLGEQALTADPDPDFLVSFALLDREPPLDEAAMAPRDGEDAPSRARRIAGQMRHGVLPIQGPPGTGKTWLGARLVGDAVRRGGRDGCPAVIAVTANSHRVIDNLLVEITGHCLDEGIDVAVGHAGSTGQVDPAIPLLKGSSAVSPWIAARQAEGRPCVVGATKFAWAREDLQGIADLLVIDEAGQLPLADALAVMQTAPVVLALGDPQQLAAPIQAAHDESIELSVLEHLARYHAVLPPSIGVFLDRSHRMHGALCDVVADLAYEGELLPSEEAARRDITGPDILVAGVAVHVEPGVAWLPVDGDADDEVAATLAVIDGLVGRATVTLSDGSSAALQADDLLVVAPHNAHVNRIAAAAPGIKVGTVDKFQGQQGHVVIYSMGRVAASPGDVAFLYELNRLNVALSRARLLAVVISQPDALFPPVVTPEQIMLASRFIRATRGRSSRRAVGGSAPN